MEERLQKIIDNKKEEVLYKMKDNDPWFPSLSWRQRITWFTVCVVLGYILDMLSYIVIIGENSTVRFAILYTIGNMLTIFSLMILVGPKRQWKNMTNKSRLTSTIIYLSCIGLTLVVALCVKNEELKRQFIMQQLIAQIMSHLWYTLSYIPWARSCCMKCFGDIAEIV